MDESQNRCLVCLRPDRVAIDEALKTLSINATAERFNVPRSSLQIHAKQCAKVVAIPLHKPGRPCATCTSPDREAIEEALLAGETYRTLERRYAVSDSSIRHHALNCVPQIMAQAAHRRADSECITAGAAKERCEAILTVLEGLVSKAETERGPECEACGRKGADVRTVAQVMREARQSVALLARITGELGPRKKLNVVGTDEWQRIEAKLVARLEKIPGALEALAELVAEERRAG